MQQGYIGARPYYQSDDLETADVETIKDVGNHDEVDTYIR